jgi:hypothetical protein
VAGRDREGENSETMNRACLKSLPYKERRLS